MINLGSDAKDRSIDELLKDHFASIPTGPGDCEEWRCTTNLIDHRIEHEFRAERMGQERMVALPEVLVLSLGRFSGTVENGEWVGVHREDVITTTETLDFSRWCQPVLPDKTIQYGLVGTSFHSGDLDAGHFKARVRDATNHWKECNDDKVSASSLRAALRAKDKQFLPNLFVYQRIHS
jgi:ubiquitin C-terminal hydrolase